jgi:hypothetical protein
MVNAPAAGRVTARRGRSTARVRRSAAQPLFLALVALALVAAVAGGLLRAGVALPGGGALLGQAAVAHAALMIGAFLGTVIGIERAVALKHRAAFLGPLCSALAGVALLFGSAGLGAGLLLAASLLFVAANVRVLRRQPAAHTVVLLLGALAWLIGNAGYAFGVQAEPVFAWWFAFLVLTIAAERLEMTRLMRRRPEAQPLLYAVLAAFGLGAATSALAPEAGGVLYGAALLVLAAWLGSYDIARRTALAHGLSRYMALCLLSGYVWLAVAGVAWAATALGWPARDWALHALGLGFIVAMMMGHAPVILPAVAGIKLHFSGAFYAPLALLQASLLLRLAGGTFDPALRAAGAVLNAAALLLFALTMVFAAWRWHQRHAPGKVRVSSLPHEAP